MTTSNVSDRETTQRLMYIAVLLSFVVAGLAAGKMTDTPQEIAARVSYQRSSEL